MYSTIGRFLQVNTLHSALQLWIISGFFSSFIFIQESTLLLQPPPPLLLLSSSLSSLLNNKKFTSKYAVAEENQANEKAYTPFNLTLLATKWYTHRQRYRVSKRTGQTVWFSLTFTLYIFVIRILFEGKFAYSNSNQQICSHQLLFDVHACAHLHYFPLLDVVAMFFSLFLLLLHLHVDVSVVIVVIVHFTSLILYFSAEFFFYLP